MSEAVVRARNLSHTYMSGTPLEQEALTDVSLEVGEGECLALCGPTGSGKSTLLQHFNGIYTPMSGTVHVLGHDLADPKTNLTLLRRQVGLVLQNPGQQLFERYVGDDVAFGPRMAGLSGPDLTRRVRWAMDQVGLDFGTFKDRPVFALSGGERRKAGLAGIIALKPKILLLDEPTAGLDPVAHAELVERLKALHQGGMTIVIATHSMDDVADLAERVVVLNAGRVQASDRVRELFSKPERVAALGLELPAAAAVAHELRELGYALGTGMLRMEETARELIELVEGRE